MKIKELLLRIINDDELPERVIYKGCWYDLYKKNYSYFEDLDYITYYLFEGDIFNHLEEDLKVIWKLKK